MKTMTCKQMGGPCDAKMQAETAEEMMQKGNEHLQAMKDDPAHKGAIDMMAQAANNPKMTEDWKKDFMQKFEAAPAE